MNGGYVSLLYRIQAMIGLPKTKMMRRSVIAVLNTSNDRVAQD